MCFFIIRFVRPHEPTMYCLLNGRILCGLWVRDLKNGGRGDPMKLFFDFVFLIPFFGSLLFLSFCSADTFYSSYSQSCSFSKFWNFVNFQLRFQHWIWESLNSLLVIYLSLSPPSSSFFGGWLQFRSLGAGKLGTRLEYLCWNLLFFVENSDTVVFSWRTFRSKMIEQFINFVIRPPRYNMSMLFLHFTSVSPFTCRLSCA